MMGQSEIESYIKFPIQYLQGGINKIDCMYRML
jgi:hypothetical protein